jgi:hypothetical protein
MHDDMRSCFVSYTMHDLYLNTFLPTKSTLPLLPQFLPNLQG